MGPYKESLVRSAVRVFLQTLAVILGVFGSITLLGILLATGAPSYDVPPPSQLTVAPDAEGGEELLGAHTPVLLRLDIEGEIGIGDLTEQAIGQMLLDSQKGTLKGRVKGILLRLNTPGGEAYNSEQIYNLLSRYKKQHNIPIYAFVDGLCASGGMFAASSADKIYSTGGSIIGSVGVLMGPIFNFTGTMEKLGVQALTLTQGKDKDALSPFRAWKPDEAASIEEITSDLYHTFVNVVTSARPRLSKEKLIQEYGAHVFVASKACEYGYVDVANADYSSTVKELASAAGIAEGERYQVLAISPAHPLLKDLMETKSAWLRRTMTHKIDLGLQLPEEFQGKFLYLYAPYLLSQ